MLQELIEKGVEEFDRVNEKIEDEFLFFKRKAEGKLLTNSA